MHVYLVELAILFVPLSIGMLLVVYGTVVKNRWGVNLEPAPQCPSCHAPKPLIRKPANFSQALWGGSTCKVCGLETDKWGRPLPPLQ